MKNLFLFLLLPLMSIGQIKKASKDQKVVAQTVAKKSIDGFVVTGTVEGLADGAVTITSTRDNSSIASGASKNGSFSLKGAVVEPGLYWLNLGKAQPHYIFLENTSIKVSGAVADIKNIKIEGAASQKDFDVFEKTFIPLFGNLNGVVAELNRAAEDKKPPLMDQYATALSNLHSEVRKFVAARPNSFVSLFVISITMQNNENILEVEQNFNLLDQKIKTSQMGAEIGNYISYAKVGAVGTDALDFTQNDVKDQPVSLSSFKGKYVLVDFWASWCRPCRMENPTVVKAFKKFKDKNFTILGVSLDREKGEWLKAIEKDNLTWTHVLDAKDEKAPAQLYRVESIPQNFLIDPSGKIVAKGLRGEDLEKKLCEYLGCSN